MNQYVKNYNRICNHVIKKSFPELRNKRLIIVEREFKSLGRALNLGVLNLIMVNPLMRKFSDKELRGLFAHELSHIQRHKNRSILSKMLFILKYSFFEKSRFKEEREADLLAIKKGYGKDIYNLLKKSYSISEYHEKRLKASHPPLSEIKKLMNKK